MHSIVDALRDFVGLWVAERHGVIVTSADNPADVVARLRANDVEADAVYRVPRDAAETDVPAVDS